MKTQHWLLSALVVLLVGVLLILLCKHLEQLGTQSAGR